MTSVAMLGETMIVVDNVPAGSPYGNAAIDMALTSGSDSTLGEYSDRLLGMNEMVKIPFRVVPFVTGNGLEVVGDLGRRGMLIRLHSKQADPGTRTYRQPRIVEYCLEHRRELLTAALTIVLAYKNEVDTTGKEVQFEMAAGSFGDWSDRIRAAVYRYTGQDPWEANRELRETAQPERRHLWALLEAIYRNLGGDEFTLNQINDACNRSDKSLLMEPIADAVDDLPLALPRFGQHVNTHALGAYLRRNKERGGPFVLHRGSGRKWFVLLGETAPNDLLLATQQRSPEVVQAMTDLLAGFPAEFSVLGHVVANELEESLGNLDEAILLALRSTCNSGQELAEQVREMIDETGTYAMIWTGQVMKLGDYLAERYPDHSALERAQEHFRRVVFELAQRTHKQADERDWIDLSREVNFIALRAVEKAVRELGPDANGEAVTGKAYSLAMVHVMATEEEGEEVTKEETNRFRDEMMSAITQLVGSRHLPHGIVERARQGRRSRTLYLGPRAGTTDSETLL